MSHSTCYWWWDEVNSVQVRVYGNGFGLVQLPSHHHPHCFHAAVLWYPAAFSGFCVMPTNSPGKEQLISEF